MYELLEVYFGKHEHFKSFFDIKLPAVVLTYGYEESSNKKQAEVILQVLEILRINKTKVLYMSIASTLEPAINNYIKAHEWKEIDMDCGVSPGTSSSSTYRVV